MTSDARAAPVLRWRPVLFGKLPAHGDFVCRGMSDAERVLWDGWASEGLAAAEAALGESFAAAHGCAPPWSFISGPGDFGQGWRAGAFAPSADSAGRRFVIVAAIDDLDWDEAAAFGLRIAAAQRDAIYRMLVESLNADAAVAAVADAAEEIEPSDVVVARLMSPAAGGIWWTAGGERHAAVEEAGAGPLRDLLARALTPVEAAA